MPLVNQPEWKRNVNPVDWSAVAGLNIVGDCTEFGRCFVGWVANGAITGAVTGLMLLWLMSRPIEPTTHPDADTQLAGKETKSST